MNCIIVDDEIPAREELKYFINTFSNMEIKKECDNGLSALKYLEKNNVDILFLDISMEGIDGMDLARIIGKMNIKTKIIFITAYKEYAVDAFEIQAFDYLLKPYSKERIISTLERIENIGKDKKCKLDTVSVLKNEKILLIDANSIYYVEAKGHSMNVYTKNDIYIKKNRIIDVEKRLKNKNFYKCHRSFIVNLEKVKEVKPWFNGTYILVMKDLNKEIPVSRSKIRELKEIIG